MYNDNCNDFVNTIFPLAPEVVGCVEVKDPDLYFVEGWPVRDDCDDFDNDCNDDDDNDCDDNDSDYDTWYESGWYPGCDF